MGYEAKKPSIAVPSAREPTGATSGKPRKNPTASAAENAKREMRDASNEDDRHFVVEAIQKLRRLSFWPSLHAPC